MSIVEERSADPDGYIADNLHAWVWSPLICFLLILWFGLFGYKQKIVNQRIYPFSIFSDC